jgi:hypothetical protein
MTSVAVRCWWRRWRSTTAATPSNSDFPPCSMAPGYYSARRSTTWRRIARRVRSGSTTARRAGRCSRAWMRATVRRTKCSDSDWQWRGRRRVPRRPRHQPR